VAVPHTDLGHADQGKLQAALYRILAFRARVHWMHHVRLAAEQPHFADQHVREKPAFGFLPAGRGRLDQERVPPSCRQRRQNNAPAASLRRGCRFGRRQLPVPIIKTLMFSE
jgi:hypothetical protein